MDLDKINLFIKGLLLLLGGITPVFLSAGYSYYIGYLSVFDLSPNILAIEWSDNITNAWYMGIIFLAEIIPYVVPGFYAILIAILLLSLMTCLLLFLRHKKPIQWLLTEHTKDNPGQTVFGLEAYRWKYIFNELYSLANKLTLGWLAVAVFILAIITVVFKPAQIAIEYATKERGAFINAQFDCDTTKNTEAFTCVELSRKDTKEVYRGLYITSSSQFIALYTKEGTLVLARNTTDTLRLLTETVTVVGDLAD